MNIRCTFTLLLVVGFSGFESFAQLPDGFKTFYNDDVHMSFYYPDSIDAILIEENMDIKLTNGRLVVQILHRQEAPFKVKGETVLLSIESVEDDCFKDPPAMWQTRSGMGVLVYRCNKESPNEVHYIGVIDIATFQIRLKFVESHNNSKPTSKVSVPEQMASWIREAIESLHFEE